MRRWHHLNNKESRMRQIIWTSFNPAFRMETTLVALCQGADGVTAKVLEQRLKLVGTGRVRPLGSHPDKAEVPPDRKSTLQVPEYHPALTVALPLKEQDWTHSCSWIPKGSLGPAANILGSGTAVVVITWWWSTSQ